MSYRTKKRFGQHFLRDHNVLLQIAGAIHPQSTDHMLEIGPGQGALTDELVDHVAKLHAVEVDNDLITQLNIRYLDHPAFDLTHADALTVQLSDLTKEKLRVVGNLPYNISSPLLFHLFEQLDQIIDMHFLLQKEVVERLCAPVGDHHYGRLSVMAQFFCDTEYVFTVPPEAFSPPPKVDSAVVRLIPKHRSYDCAQFKVFSDLVRTAFNHRRKTLSNALKTLVSMDQFTAANIDPSKRPQALSTDEYWRLASVLD